MALAHGGEGGGMVLSETHGISSKPPGGRTGVLPKAVRQEDLGGSRRALFLPGRCPPNALFIQCLFSPHREGHGFLKTLREEYRQRNTLFKYSTYMHTQLQSNQVGGLGLGSLSV